MIQVLCPDNGAGLTRDGHLIYNLLKENDFDVDLTNSLGKTNHKHYKINVYLEHFLPEWQRTYFNTAKRNILIPNPEWFHLEWKPLLKHAHYIFAKTRDCEKIFKALVPHHKVKFTSFTSEDRYVHSVRRHNEFFHSCGKSQSKGTKAITTLWEKKNKYPKLHLLTKPELHKFSTMKRVHAENINHIVSDVPDDQFILMQNRFKFHLCPSIYEGFGHYINEGKSMKSIVITTDGPPMNELVTKDFGFLVRVEHRKLMRLTETYLVNPVSLWRSMDNDILKIMDNQPLIDEMGERARNSYLANDKLFKERFINHINYVLKEC